MIVDFVENKGVGRRDLRYLIALTFLLSIFALICCQLLVLFTNFAFLSVVLFKIVANHFLILIVPKVRELLLHFHKVIDFNFHQESSCLSYTRLKTYSLIILGKNNFLADSITSLAFHSHTGKKIIYFNLSMNYYVETLAIFAH